MGDDTDRKIKFTAYWEVLCDLSPDTVISVCRRASRGEVGQPGFLPTAAELYQAATKCNNSEHRYPMLNEPYRAVSREERARVIQGFKDLKSELAENMCQPVVSGWETLGEAMQLREWND
jgi:hypothetical protein